MHKEAYTGTEVWNNMIEDAAAACSHILNYNASSSLRILNKWPAFLYTLRNALEHDQSYIGTCTNDVTRTSCQVSPRYIRNVHVDHTCKITFTVREYPTHTYVNTCTLAMPTICPHEYIHKEFTHDSCSPSLHVTWKVNILYGKYTTHVQLQRHQYTHTFKASTHAYPCKACGHMIKECFHLKSQNNKHNLQ